MVVENGGNLGFPGGVIRAATISGIVVATVTTAASSTARRTTAATATSSTSVGGVSGATRSVGARAGLVNDPHANTEVAGTSAPVVGLVVVVVGVAVGLGAIELPGRVAALEGLTC